MYVHLLYGGCAVRGLRSVIGALTLPLFKPPSLADGTLLILQGECDTLKFNLVFGQFP